jgi:flagellar export protein FliJ
MRPFRFRLEKALEWRRLQLRQQEARFQQQAAALEALDRRCKELETASRHAEAGVREWDSLSGADLAALDGYRTGVQRLQRRLADQRREGSRELASRQQALLEAQRRVRVLERIKEQRLREWKASGDRELQELASESFLARWKREP